MTQKEKKLKVKFEGCWLTITETTDIKLRNPDIVKEFLIYSDCKLEEDIEGKPIIVSKTYCGDLVPSVKDVEKARKGIEQFEGSLRETDREVERIKFIVESLLKKEETK